jgi:hypothetical protein
VVAFELILACSFSFFQNRLDPWPQTGFFYKKLLVTTQGIIIIKKKFKIGWVVFFVWGGAPHRVLLFFKFRTGWASFFNKKLASRSA